MKASGAIALCAFAVLVGGCRASSSGDRIAFVSSRAGNPEIYVMNPDGSGARRLTDDPGMDLAPAWAPDGTRIAFSSNRGGSVDIYIMSADGGEPRRVTSAAGAETSPAWSPDGKSIAFVTSPFPQAKGDIAIMEADGTHVVKLTNDLASDDGGPSWSRDGRHIAFHSDRGGNGYHVWVMDADGTALKRLSDGDGEEPAWSPDGARIVFASTRDGNPKAADPVEWNEEIYTMMADGSGVTRLTQIPGNDHWPSWSPDGKLIAFTCDGRQKVGEICTINADGSGLRTLTKNSAQDLMSVWEPL
jgi:TolB protein